MIVGLTGGIGSGKTTVLQLFEELGAATFVADVEAKKLMVEDVKLINNIKQLLGEKAYLNQKLNKPYIAQIVFKEKDKLLELNKLVHPKVHNQFKQFIKKTEAKIIIYEAAILFESGSSKLCDYIITVVANQANKIKRVMLRDNVTEEQVLDRMKNQIDDNQKILQSHFVIQNTTLLHTKEQVKTIYNLLELAVEN